MKLGISYMVFDGEELLKFATKSIRDVVDFISVTYQPISYFGNKSNESFLDDLYGLQKIGLIDEIIFYDNDLSLHHKTNELNLRNLGLECSKKAGCTHHISADVDELYKSDELVIAKNIIEDNDYDFSMAPYITYYKEPTYQIHPRPEYNVSFIHKINNEYEINKTFIFPIEITRRLKNNRKYIVFDKNTFAMHHMSYIRRDIRKKIENSDNGRFFKIDDFVDKFNKYKLGERLCIPPDFLNRKTIEVPNYFNITIKE